MKALQMTPNLSSAGLFATCTAMTRAGKPHSDRVEEKGQS
jgi:hypothetical protein